MGLVYFLLRWIVHAAVVMASVGIVDKGNRSNTLGRAMLVTVVVAVVVSPFAWAWWLLIPGIIALIAWCLVYSFAYGLGVGQSLGAGILQALIGMAVDYFLVRHALRNGAQ